MQPAQDQQLAEAQAALRTTVSRTLPAGLLAKTIAAQLSSVDPPLQYHPPHDETLLATLGADARFSVFEDAFGRATVYLR